MTCVELLTLPLAERIRWLRLREGSHDKLAARLGTSRQTVIGWEKGGRPGPRYRARLAELTGCPPETFQPTEIDVAEWQTVNVRLEALEASVRQAERERLMLIGAARRLGHLVAGQAAPSESGEVDSILRALEALEQD